VAVGGGRQAIREPRPLRAVVPLHQKRAAAAAGARQAENLVRETEPALAEPGVDLHHVDLGWIDLSDDAANDRADVVDERIGVALVAVEGERRGHQARHRTPPSSKRIAACRTRSPTRRASMVSSCMSAELVIAASCCSLRRKQETGDRQQHGVGLLHGSSKVAATRRKTGRSYVGFGYANDEASAVAVAEGSSVAPEFRGVHAVRP
jgi:hypothetical protein